MILDRARVAAAIGLTLLGCAAPGTAQTERPRSKKGLQVQMVDDAIALGISHATLNVQLGHLLRRGPRREGDVALPSGQAIAFDALDRLDARIRPLAAADIELSFILLARATQDPAIDRLQFDPRYDPKAPNRLRAFRVLDELGRTHFRAVIDTLAERYGEASEIGTVRGWIVGNEVNSHWWWYNLGRAEIADVVAAYEPAVRLVHEAATSHNSDARVYVSLEHHWQARFAAGSVEQSCSGRALLDRFAELAQQRGDFAWHVAYHPYPERLFDCRFWEDESATPVFDSPRITFKNLGVLTRYLAREELLFHGRPRRVILSEQGFHCRKDARGAADQELAFALAWRKVQDLDGIDAFIYHRHVDHAREGGLRFGLFENLPGTISDPGKKRPLWELFRNVDRPGEDGRLQKLLREFDRRQVKDRR
ncbi:MAG: DUF5722 domain-containing protein [bacterium]|nr:DUF5722 domain-containing protein [bacterium]